MPPRRSAARPGSATPAPVTSPAKRSTRGTSNTAVDGSTTKHTTRATIDPTSPPNMLANPRLPEIQTQQSYAYGASKTPMLPEQLVAREKMSLRQMADTIDQGIRQAEKQLETHAAEAEANLNVPAGKDARSERARRRASREGSAESETSETRKTRRTAEWASSLDSNHLEDIPEGDSRSSFPSGIFDHSYNYERGLRRPRVKRQSKIMDLIYSAKETMANSLIHVYNQVLQVVTAIEHWIRRLMKTASRTVMELPESPVMAVLSKALFGLLLAGVASVLMCSLSRNFLCEPGPTSTLGLAMERYCGVCTRTPGDAFNITGADRHDISKLPSALKAVSLQMRTIESRLGDKVDAKYATMESDLESLRRQQNDLSRTMANLEAHQPASAERVPSPLIARINYFSPSLGALIDPRRTSPTKQKPLSLVQGVVLRMVGMTQYRSKPPITALEPWQDVGDCWCSSDATADQESVRLGVTVHEMIYPTELVVEHYPSGGSLSPGTTPRHIEVWADFRHLDGREWERLGIRAMQGSDPLMETYALLGRMEYDASKNAHHVQTFPLAVNQHELMHHAQEFVIRVASNYGAEHTCLYRVRMHGIALAAQPGAGGTADGHEGRGYEAG